MYEAVYAHPDGKSTVARFAKRAADYGFEGVVVRNHADARAAYDPERIREEYGIDVVEGSRSAPTIDNRPAARSEIIGPPKPSSGSTAARTR